MNSLNRAYFVAIAGLLVLGFSDYFMELEIFAVISGSLVVLAGIHMAFKAGCDVGSQCGGGGSIYDVPDFEEEESE